MNEYDSDKIADILSQNGGYIKTDKPENADVIVINTCSIREKAEEKIFSALGVFRKLKLKKTELIIGVAGCVASQEGANILIRAPYIDLIFGPQTIHRILELIDARKETKKPQIDLSFPTIEKFDFLPQTKTTSASAFVSIMEGCSKYCSYCVVPYTRGEEVSRDVSGILKEINHLASQGVKEVNLLGQNVNAYCGVLSDGEAVDFAFLLKAIHNIDGIERIRYTTSHPKEMTQRIIECYAELPKLMPHLHLPVQSGSDRILAQMKRGYTVLEYKSIIKKLRKIRKNMSMSSDFIVGFPGETEEDFKKTIDLINDIGYDNSYSFIFSPRPGTPAASLPDITPMGIKLERLRLLQTTIDAFSKSISESMVETTQAVLVEGQSKRHNELTGRTENNKTVNFAGDISLINTIVNLKIINTTSYSLIAQLI